MSATTQQIEALLQEAGSAGDEAMVAICRRALDGHYGIVDGLTAQHCNATLWLVAREAGR